jgi:hypothetical protein
MTDIAIYLLGSLILGMAIITDYCFGFIVLKAILPKDYKDFIKNVGYGIVTTGLLLGAGVGGTSEPFTVVSLIMAGYSAVKLSEVLT